MALTVGFSTSQTPGVPEDITFTDSTTGVDAAVVSRRIYIQDSSGNFYVEDGTTTDYEVWGSFPATTTIDLTDILPEDIGARVTVQWLNVSNTVLYDLTSYIGFNCFNEDFDYSLTQNLAANPLLINDNNFRNNKSRLRNDIDSGDKAISRASDIYNCQQAYDRATELRVNSQYYFNVNS